MLARSRRRPQLRHDQAGGHPCVDGGRPDVPMACSRATYGSRSNYQGAVLRPRAGRPEGLVAVIGWGSTWGKDGAVPAWPCAPSSRGRGSVGRAPARRRRARLLPDVQRPNGAPSPSAGSSTDPSSGPDADPHPSTATPQATARSDSPPPRLRSSRSTAATIPGLPVRNGPDPRHLPRRPRDPRGGGGARGRPVAALFVQPQTDHLGRFITHVGSPKRARTGFGCWTRRPR